MEIVAAESNFVLGAALEWLSDNKKKSFSQLHPAVQRVCVRLQLRVLGFSAPFELVEKLCLQPDRVVNVDSKNSVYRDSTGMVYPRKKQSFSFGEAEVKVDLKKTTNIQFRERMFSWSFENHVGDSIQRKKDCEWFDARKVGTKVYLRHWKQGDRFQPIGAKSVAKLQDLFTNQKIPRAERHRLIVATTEQGELFWVEGLRISERFKLDKASMRRLKWRWQPLESD